MNLTAYNQLNETLNKLSDTLTGTRNSTRGRNEPLPTNTRTLGQTLADQQADRPIANPRRRHEPVNVYDVIMNNRRNKINEIKASGESHLDLPNGDFVVIYFVPNADRLAIVYDNAGSTKCVSLHHNNGY